MTKTEALKEIERLQRYVESQPDEPKAEPKRGQRYWTVTFKGGEWRSFDCKWGACSGFDRDRLKSGIVFWEGTDEENKAAAQRAILRCRYVLEDQWKPSEGQEVWAWQSDGSTIRHIFSWNSGTAVRWLSEGYYSPAKEEAEKRRDEFGEALLWGLK